MGRTPKDDGIAYFEEETELAIRDAGRNPAGTARLQDLLRRVETKAKALPAEDFQGALVFQSVAETREAMRRMLADRPLFTMSQLLRRPVTGSRFDLNDPFELGKDGKNNLSLVLNGRRDGDIFTIEVTVLTKDKTPADISNLNFELVDPNGTPIRATRREGQSPRFQIRNSDLKPNASIRLRFTDEE